MKVIQRKEKKDMGQKKLNTEKKKKKSLNLQHKALKNENRELSVFLERLSMFRSED